MDCLNTMDGHAHARLLAAFQAMHWTGWTFEAAMRDDIRSRIVRARAAAMARADYEATHTRTVRLVRRCNPTTGAWCTQRVAGDFDDQQLSIT